MVIDCCVALLRVYLPSYHVVPILLLHPRLGSWSHNNSCRGHVRTVYVLDCLVSHYFVSLFESRDDAHIHLREFCLRHPEIRDVCDVGQMLYFGWTWVWYLTAAMFLLNNTFIQVRSLECLSIGFLLIG